mmetsp:Transcript_7442/g.25161  ORF Transcript_7442/g.25161 Transcript_7442/m.25161 type:complete len:335 (-) Transcript_7442:1248-2252(-)
MRTVPSRRWPPQREPGPQLSGRSRRRQHPLPRVRRGAPRRPSSAPWRAHCAPCLTTRGSGPGLRSCCSCSRPWLAWGPPRRPSPSAAAGSRGFAISACSARRRSSPRATSGPSWATRLCRRASPRSCVACWRWHATRARPRPAPRRCSMIPTRPPGPARSGATTCCASMPWSFTRAPLTRITPPRRRRSSCASGAEAVNGSWRPSRRWWPGGSRAATTRPWGPGSWRFVRGWRSTTGWRQRATAPSSGGIPSRRATRAFCACCGSVAPRATAGSSRSCRAFARSCRGTRSCVSASRRCASGHRRCRTCFQPRCRPPRRRPPPSSCPPPWPRPSP